MRRFGFFVGLALVYGGVLVGAAGVTTWRLSDRLGKLESRIEQASRVYYEAKTTEDGNPFVLAGVGFALFVAGALLVERSGRPQGVPPAIPAAPTD